MKISDAYLAEIRYRLPRNNREVSSTKSVRS